MTHDSRRVAGNIWFVACVVTIAGGALLCCSGHRAEQLGRGLSSVPGEARAAAASTGDTAPRQTTEGSSLGDARVLEDAIVSAADHVIDSVVALEVEIPVQGPSRGAIHSWPFPDSEGDMLDPLGLFRRLEPRHGVPNHLDEPLQRLRTGGGSGVIHSTNGVIVTNNHVVENATSIWVTLHDGRTFEATLVGADPESDLAVVEIEADGLPAVEYADTEGIRPGQFAIAVGMPYQLDYSVTVGHVSALGRGGLRPSTSDPTLQRGPSTAMSIQNFIQTDAAINPGNSGGPLVDLEGRVMGINSIVHGGIGGGFGFAIPADMVRRVAAQLLESGTVSRAWIGLSMSDLTFEKGQALGVDHSMGALVEEVFREGPADEAEMRRGDVITAVDGVEVKDADDVVYRVTSHEAGEPVAIVYLRGGEERSASIVTGDRDAGLSDAGVSTGAADVPRRTQLDSYGMTLDEVDEPINRALGRAANATGVVVRSVVPSGPAARAGLQPGDVIVDVEGTVARDPDSVLSAIAESDKPYVALSVEREGRPRYVALRRAVD